MTRYCEAPTVEASTLVNATPEKLWPLVTDIELIASLSTELQRVRWLDDAGDGASDGAALGRRFEGTNFHQARGEWRTTSSVIVCAEPRAFSWAVEDVDDPTAVWGFELTPTDGGTMLRQFAQMGPGPSGLSQVIERMPEKEERIVEYRLREFRASIERNLAALRELAEDGRPPAVL
jgi:Polyketide cyclase / dehydrase and lipid transport